MLVQAIITAALMGLVQAAHLWAGRGCWLDYFLSHYRSRTAARRRVAVNPRGAVIGRLDDCLWFETTPGDFMALRVHSRDVGGAFTIVEARVLPLSGPPAHIHEGRDEIFQALEGSFRFQCAGDVFDVAPGTSVVVPRGVAHCWVNLGPTPARILFAYVPGGIDELFTGLGKASSPQQLAQLAALHDTLIVGPRLVLEGATQPCRIDPHDAEIMLL